jgi:prepilin-type N-terminal cleavage/methylation domain-containing protein
MLINSIKKGFTLIELLVVIAIISLLASVVLTSLQSARQAAKDSSRKSSLVQLRNALELYASTHAGQYPTTPGCGSGASARAHCWLDSTPEHNPTDYIPGLVPTYIGKLPQEPDVTHASGLCWIDGTVGDNEGTSYRYLSDGISYKVHDHCPPKTPSNTNVNDSFYYCPSSSGHPYSWSIYGGIIGPNDWCDPTSDNSGVN